MLLFTHRIFQATLFVGADFADAAGGRQGGRGSLKWVWFIKSGRGPLNFSRASRAIVIQPHHTKIPRSVPVDRQWATKCRDVDQSLLELSIRFLQALAYYWQCYVLLTLGAHAHEGYSSLSVCLFVCLSVCYQPTARVRHL